MRKGVGGLFGLRGGCRRSNASRLIGSYWSALWAASRPTNSSSEQELSLRPPRPIPVHITGSVCVSYALACTQAHTPKIPAAIARRTRALKRGDCHRKDGDVVCSVGERLTASVVCVYNRQRDAGRTPQVGVVSTACTGLGRV